MKINTQSQKTQNIKNRLLKICTAIALTVSAVSSSILPAASGRTAAAEKTVKIMPLGDSITYGMADEGGYRKYLSYFLKQKGYNNVDLVGPEGKDSATFSYNGQNVIYDDNHAGYSGYTITNLAGGWMGQLHGILETMQSGDYIKKYSPDIILLQIGTNDVNNGYLDGSENRLHQLLDYLRENMPSDGKIFLTTIPDLGSSGWGNSSKNADIAKYNELIRKVADDYSSRNVIFADIHSVIDASKDLADGVHPNASGYEKMGRYWLEQIESCLSEPGTQQTTAVQPATSQDGSTPAVIYGDLDGDKRITTFDAVIMRIGLLSDFKDSSAKKAADIDRNGRPEVADLVQLQNYLLGRITQFAVSETPGTEIPVFEKSYSFPSVSSLKSSKDVPDPFIFMDGSKVKSQDDWWKRQSEISCMYEYYMYGKWRDGSDDEVTYSISGSKMTVNVKRRSTGKTASFPVNINLPSKVRHEGGAPVIVGMHSGIAESTATSNGYAVLTIGGDIFSNPVAADSTAHTGPFYTLYPYGNSWDEQTGVLMAWSWGCSKILDALYNGAAKELNINPDSSIVTGVSRWGKATAVCGAFDKRFKMCAPSCSGAGGIALYRYMSEGKTYDFSSKGASSSYRYGQNEPLSSLQSSGERGWFNDRFMEFNDSNKFPMDQHMLGALCCDPDRYLFIIGSCVSEDWVNAPSMWMSYCGMKHIWDYVGLGDHLAINIHKEGHAVIAEDVEKMIQYFDYHVYGIQPKMDLGELKTSVFELSGNKDSYQDTFTSKWTY